MKESNGGVKTAVILAAGMGTRLKSVTNDMIPKGFLEIAGQTLVARSIKNLLSNGIEKVIIVTGHLHQYYDELAQRNDNIVTVHNSDYGSTGSMASLAVAHLLLEEDFLLLESDLIYEERGIQVLQQTVEPDCILLSGETKSGDEVYVEVQNQGIHKISKDKNSLQHIYGELVGICKISKALLDVMMVEYEKNTNPQYHYEYAIADAAQHYTVGYQKIDDLVWSEIDDASHLERVKQVIVPKLVLKKEL